MGDMRNFIKKPFQVKAKQGFELSRWSCGWKEKTNKQKNNPLVRQWKRIARHDG